MKFDKLKPDLQNLNLAGVKKAASRAARVRVKLSRRQWIAIACTAIVAGLLLALLLRPRPEQQSEQQARDDRGAGYRNPLPAAQLHADTGRTRSCLLHAGQIQVLQIGFQLVKFHRVYIK